MGANLGLYSVTFNNNLERDLATLERFHEFREEAERKGFRYFLEVFDPNIPGAVAPEVLPSYINDMITRMLAGVGPTGRPRLPEDGLSRSQGHGRAGAVRPAPGRRHPGRLGRHHARRLSAPPRCPKYGAKVALFGRKINNAENQLAFVHFLRLIVEGQVGPVDAVKAYHAVLGRLGLRPNRSLDDDLRLTDQSMSYAGTAGSSKVAVSTTERFHASSAFDAIGRGLEQRSLSLPRPSAAQGKRSCRSVRLYRRLGRHRVVNSGFPIQSRPLQRCHRRLQRPA